MQGAHSYCTSVRFSARITPSQFFRAQGLAVAKRHNDAAARLRLIVADNGQRVTKPQVTLTMQRSAGQRCVHASLSIAVGGPRASQHARHDQLLGCMGKFSCAVTNVGDAFQEQSGQYRKRLRLSGPPAGYGGDSALLCNPAANARSSAQRRQSMCV